MEKVRARGKVGQRDGKWVYWMALAWDESWTGLWGWQTGELLVRTLVGLMASRGARSREQRSAGTWDIHWGPRSGCLRVGSMGARMAARRA